MTTVHIVTLRFAAEPTGATTVPTVALPTTTLAPTTTDQEWQEHQPRDTLVAGEACEELS